MAAYARLKNEFTEDEMCHNLMAHFVVSQSQVFPLGAGGGLQTLFYIDFFIFSTSSYSSALCFSH